MFLEEPYDYKTSCCIVYYNTGGYAPHECENPVKYFVFKEDKIDGYCENCFKEDHWEFRGGKQLTEKEVEAAEILIS